MKKFLIAVLVSIFTFSPVFADFDTYHEESYSHNYEGQEEEMIIKIDKGSRVEHPQFGKGTVQQVIDYKGKIVYSVLFDNSVKKFVKPNSIKKL